MGLYVYDCVSVDWGSGGRGSVWVAFNRLNNILSAGRRVYIWRASGRVGGGGGQRGEGGSYWGRGDLHEIFAIL